MNPTEKHNPVEEKVLEAAQIVEDQVDAAIEMLDNLDVDELNKIRRDRLAAMRKEMQFKEEWIKNGHGEHSTLTTEREFFDILKKSDRVVLHCYKCATMRCNIVDKHLDILAKRHVETKFCKIDVEKAPFITAKLGVRVIPTILLCVDSKRVDAIVGFDDLGGVDDFSTDIMEWRIAKAGVINYDGDLTSPPDPAETKRAKRSMFTHVKKTIRDADESSDSDSEGQGDH